MIIDWPADFDRYIDRLEEKAGAGDQHARTVLDHLYAQLQMLQDLPAPPTEETPTLKQVRQSGRIRSGGSDIPTTRMSPSG